MHKVTTNLEWLQARKELLKREKEFSRQRDALSAARRELPWVKVGADYSFEDKNGKKSLLDLFGDRSQLIVYHFMLTSEMKAGCTGCSFMMDNLPANRTHLEHADLRFVVISRAPLAKIQEYQNRMGWNFDWLSSAGSRFNYDFDVSFTPDQVKDAEVVYNYGTEQIGGEEQPGLSVFFKDESGEIFHTYSTFSRGLDEFLPTYHYLDITPKGRDETSAMSWIKRQDEYELNSKS